jgi:hypothetical protein
VAVVITGTANAAAPEPATSSLQLRVQVVARASLWAAHGLPDAVRGGGVPFERVYGHSLLEHRADQAEHGWPSQASMAARSRHEAAWAVSAYDFHRFRHLVDVGGGNGTLLTAVVESGLMGPGSILLLAEAVLPERAADAPAVLWMDLNTLIVASGGNARGMSSGPSSNRPDSSSRQIVDTGSEDGLAVLEAAPTTR